MTAGGGVADRVPRLLTVVPYLLAHPGVRVADAAAAFGVSEAQMRRDLELLWMCGLPGYGPGDLVDLSFSGDTVTVAFDAGMRRPLRLSGPEAATLAVALRALADAPGVVDTDAVARALVKIEEAAGPTPADPGAAPTGDDAGIAVDLGRVPGRAEAAVRSAVERGRVLRMTYYSASRDTISRRDVDPVRLLLSDGSTYLQAWCRSAESVRLFRLDRVEEAEVLDEPAAPPAGAVADADPDGDLAALVRPGADGGPRGVATLWLAPSTRWVAEYYPVEDLVADDDGSARVRLHYGDRDWMLRLLLGLGDGVAVLWPEALATALAARADAALAAYGALTPPGP